MEEDDDALHHCPVAQEQFLYFLLGRSLSFPLTLPVAFLFLFFLFIALALLLPGTPSD